FRKDLRRALGLEVWDAARGAGERGPQGRWVPGRQPTQKERALFEEGKYTLPVDFHSWRRAWSQALKRVGANVQTAAALPGHASDLRAHGRYLDNPTEAQVVPAGVVPALLISGPREPQPAAVGILVQRLDETRGGVMKNMKDIERARV